MVVLDLADVQGIAVLVFMKLNVHLATGFSKASTQCWIVTHHPLLRSCLPFAVGVR
jgi:hypothetical protein